MPPLAYVVAVAVAGAVLSACGGGEAGGGANGSRTVDPAFAEYGLPAYPGAERFDDGRVIGTDGSEITYASFATADAPAEVLTFYRQRLGTGGFTREDSGGTWRLPAGQPPERTISVGSPDANVGPPGGDPPPESAATVIAVSRLSRR